MKKLKNDLMRLSVSVSPAEEAVRDTTRSELVGQELDEPVSPMGVAVRDAKAFLVQPTSDIVMPVSPSHGKFQALLQLLMNRENLSTKTKPTEEFVLDTQRIGRPPNMEMSGGGKLVDERLQLTKDNHACFSSLEVGMNCATSSARSLT